MTILEIFSWTRSCAPDPAPHLSSLHWPAQFQSLVSVLDWFSPCSQH